MKYAIQFTNQFKKDLKLAKKQNKNLDNLFEVINQLANGENLMPSIEIMICQENIVELVNVISNPIGY